MKDLIAALFDWAREEGVPFATIVWLLIGLATLWIGGKVANWLGGTARVWFERYDRLLVDLERATESLRKQRDDEHVKRVEAERQLEQVEGERRKLQHEVWKLRERLAYKNDNEEK